MDFGKLKKVAEEYVAKSGGKAGKAIENVSHALATPQRYVTKKLTEAVGLKDAGSSESNFAQLAEKGAEAIGIAPDSTTGNVLKAGAVAAGEVFGDPLGFIPLGKIAKGIKGVAALDKLPMLGRIAQEAKVINLAEKSKAKALEKLADKLKAEDMQFITGQSSKETATYKKLMEAKKAQEAAPVQKLKPEPPPKSKIQMGNDAVLAQEAMKIARATGVPPEREAAFVQLYLRSRGVK